jgi:hypothetical protein
MRTAGPALLVGLFACMQIESIAVERTSNRLSLMDGHCEATLLAYASELPGSRGRCRPGLEPVGAARLEFTSGIYRWDCADADAGLCLEGPVPADQLGPLIVEQQMVGGAGGGGRIVLRTADGTAEREFAMAHAGGGVYRYRIDLHSLAEGLRGRPVRVLLKPAAGASSVVLYGLDCFNRLGRPIVVSRRESATLPVPH